MNRLFKKGANASDAPRPYTARAVANFVDKYCAPLIIVVVVVLAWEVIFRIRDVPVYIVPKPSDIILGLVDDGALFWKQGRWTILEAVIGFFIGSSIGFGLGTLFALVRLLEKGVVPLVVAANCVPIVAIAPVVNMWLGSGMVSKIMIASFLCFFPVCVNTVKGMHSTEPIKRDLFQCLAANRLQVFRKLQIPSSLPFIFTGLRISSTAAVLGTIVAEFVGAQKGIGYLIISAAYEMRMARLWGSVVISMVLGILFFNIVGLIERIAVPWREAIEDVT